MAVLKFLDPETKEWKELMVVSDGVTFLPEIDKNGQLSWSNNGYLPNPEPISLLGDTIVMKATQADFPLEGKEYALYIDKSTGSLYRWDGTIKKYRPLSPEAPIPVEGGIVFAKTVPAAEDAQNGIIYAVQVSADRRDNFELWTKADDKMVMLEGSSGDIDAELDLQGVVNQDAKYYATKTDIDKMFV